MDFDVHGVLGVRVLDGDSHDLEAVARDLGPPGDLGGRDPDVIVCFVDDLRPTSLRLIDGETTAYGDDGVYFLESSGGPPLAHVRQGEGWGEALIVCRRGARRVPTLATSLDLAALARGWIALHASGWVIGGQGVLAAGWPHSGKTGALLAACEHGATAVGDDRILLAGDGRTFAGVGRPIVGRDWHLAQLSLPELDVGRFRRVLARATPSLKGLADRLPSDRTVGRPARKAVGRLRASLDVELAPERLGRNGSPPLGARPDLLVLLETHRREAIEAQRIEPGRVADRLAAQVEAELLPALRAHLAFEYATDACGWKSVREAPATARRLLQDATRGIPAYVVRHPYPCSLKELHRVICRHLALPAARASERRTARRLGRAVPAPGGITG